MKYSSESKITQEFIKDISEIRGEPSKDYITKELVTKIINKMPIEDIKKLFKVKIHDPETFDWARDFHSLDIYTQQLLLILREERTILINVSIDI